MPLDNSDFIGFNIIDATSQRPINVALAYVGGSTQLAIAPGR
jgi:hypothetical protein